MADEPVHKGQLLIHGYIRHIQQKLSQIVPLAIISVCFDFFSSKWMVSTLQHKTKSRQLHASIWRWSYMHSETLKNSVRLPGGETRINEWYVVHIIEFFNEIRSIYCLITDYCTIESCPKMSAGPKYEYLWLDTKNPKYKKHYKCSAPEYIDLMMSWAYKLIHIFPKNEASFPKNFRKIVKKISKRYFRIYAHIYYHHLGKIKDLDGEKQLNSYFKHFIYFIKEFKLVDDKELKPMHDTMDILKIY